MKHSVGDKVKIREDLVVGNMYGVNDFARKMAQYKGKTATIITTSEHNNMYHIDIDNECWYWTDEMFEEGHISKFNVGDKVRVRRDLEVYKKYNGLTLTNDMYDCHHNIMTIESVDDDNYTCEESCYFWGEDMLEKVEEVDDNEQVKTVDVGFYLDYCGHKIIKNVYYGGYAYDNNHVFCTTVDGKNQYTFPVDSIEFIVPHED